MNRAYKGFSFLHSKLIEFKSSHRWRQNDSKVYRRIHPHEKHTKKMSGKKIEASGTTFKQSCEETSFRVDDRHRHIGIHHENRTEEEGVRRTAGSGTRAPGSRTRTDSSTVSRRRSRSASNAIYHVGRDILDVRREEEVAERFHVRSVRGREAWKPARGQNGVRAAAAAAGAVLNTESRRNAGVCVRVDAIASARVCASANKGRRACAAPSRPPREAGAAPYERGWAPKRGPLAGGFPFGGCAVATRACDRPWPSSDARASLSNARFAGRLTDLICLLCFGKGLLCRSFQQPNPESSWMRRKTNKNPSLGRFWFDEFVSSKNKNGRTQMFRTKVTLWTNRILHKLVADTTKSVHFRLQRKFSIGILRRMIHDTRKNSIKSTHPRA